MILGCKRYLRRKKKGGRLAHAFHGLSLLAHTAGKGRDGASRLQKIVIVRYVGGVQEMEGGRRRTHPAYAFHGLPPPLPSREQEQNGRDVRRNPRDRQGESILRQWAWQLRGWAEMQASGSAVGIRPLLGKASGTKRSTGSEGRWLQQT